MDTSLSNAFSAQLCCKNRQTMLSTYYRSKLFTVPFTTNPIVAAAGPLFSVLERLYLSNILPPIALVCDNIKHELCAFQSRLHAHGLNDELTIIAMYLLTATVDELIGKSYLKLNNYALEFQAFTPLTADDLGPEERFFIIVNHIIEQPNQYLDLIELAYYCLIAGFEGIYHQKVDGRLTLDHLIEVLFQLIKQHRVSKPQLLFKTTDNIAPPPLNDYKHLFITFLVVASITVLSFTMSYLFLAQQAKSIEQSYLTYKLDK